MTEEYYEVAQKVRDEIIDGYKKVEQNFNKDDLSLKIETASYGDQGIEDKYKLNISVMFYKSEDNFAQITYKYHSPSHRYVCNVIKQSNFIHTLKYSIPLSKFSEEDTIDLQSVKVNVNKLDTGKPLETITLEEHLNEINGRLINNKI